MKKNIFAVLLVVLLLFSSTNFKTAAAGVSANSAVLIEQESGRILYSKNPHAVGRIASITKIMTAILAIESGMLNEKVKISAKAVQAEGSSLYLKKGEKILLKHLVYGLMLRSGNDAATAIAEHVGGSREGFAYLMNNKAQEIGMKNTYFANPHGLDDDDRHRSTAYDMALLTRYAMENSVYREVAGTKVYKEAPAPDSKWNRVWRNKNRLLTEKYDYCTGGKTGYTKLAKRTLVTTATKGDMDLIAVTLNAPDDWNDHISMYEKGFDTFDPKIVAKKGTIKAVKNSFYSGKVFLNRDVVYPLKKKEVKQVSIHYRLVKPHRSWESGGAPNVVGEAEIFLKKKKLYTLPVYYEQIDPVKEKSIWQKWKEGLFS